MWRYYEKLTIGDDAQYPFPFNGFPAQLRRCAIRKAIGAWESWNTSYQKWLNRIPLSPFHHSEDNRGGLDSCSASASYANYYIQRDILNFLYPYSR
ncbi:hypothetical protein WA1_00010 [Scytonema hofmannii PCC 7110]|uniref:Uncharacterized protein n=1 Tax=Scytonema hofmannii PCC 7110 TaxID=128403 RepID=A0A139XFY5_9CYAN|nr:hypothetical protein [Scytonema hofmannii]KYC43598.1 hypothetical protein WA1_00010 [Scytonema hofmannii PCC 7110]